MMTLKMKRKDWIALINNTVEKYGIDQCIMIISELEKKMNIEIVRD